MQTSPNYRAALRRACCIAIWRIALLTMARRARDLRRALDVNGNWTRMQNRAIVYARVCVIRMCAYMAPHCRCVLCGRRDADCAAHMRRICGAYAVAVGVIAHELVVACSTGCCYSAAQRSMRICMGEVPLWGIEFRVQGAGCRCKAS